MKLLSLRGCGQQGSHVVRTLLNYEEVTTLCIADIDKGAARTFAAKLNDSRVVIWQSEGGVDPDRFFALLEENGLAIETESLALE